jgi:hypothetical protein
MEGWRVGRGREGKGGKRARMEVWRGRGLEEQHP